MFSNLNRVLRVTSDDIQGKVTEGELLSYYLGIDEVPCVINSPLRDDNHPSLGFYSNDGIKIRFKDYATNENGGIYDFFMKLWNCNYTEALEKIYKDLPRINGGNCSVTKTTSITKRETYHKESNLECKTREWQQHDLDYWEVFGISKDWLEFAEVHPISHKIVTKNNKRYVFPADKFAYAFVERKEGNISLKIYQPLNTEGYKWANKNDGSVIGLWTKVPEYGERICICSSLKDALCLWANSGIPCVFLQGEGYNMSDTAVNELKRRFHKIYVCFDNDEAGLADARKLCEEKGFINVVLPQFPDGKDISDFMKSKGRQEFCETLRPLFNI